MNLADAPLCTSSLYLYASRDGSSIPGYVLCIVPPLLGCNLKMRRVANTQHLQRRPRKNGFRSPPSTKTSLNFSVQRAVAKAIRLFIICCAVYQLQITEEYADSRPPSTCCWWPSLKHSISCSHFFLGSLNVLISWCFFNFSVKKLQE